MYSEKTIALTRIRTPPRLEHSLVTIPNTLSGIVPWTFRTLEVRALVAQRVGRGIALLFHDRDTRRGWVVSSTPRPHFTPGKDPIPIVQEAGWAPGPVWTGAENLVPTGIRSRTVQSVAQLLYLLSYRAYKTDATANKRGQQYRNYDGWRKVPRLYDVTLILRSVTIE